MGEEYATKLHQHKSTLYGESNVRFLVINNKDKLGTLETWINPEVTSNIFSTPKLKKDGYKIIHDTKGEYLVYTPEGKVINFKRDYAHCKGITYLRKTGSEVIILQTLRKKFE